ncbi:DUF3592 domain-containing protein [Streptomyces sp. NPDC015171]|uniref:DUF3592 domain-containing protein n=1 Tax=Streptomyces sp. NPDC015171 TaxID=3364945 RepID=UPI0036FAEA54
MLIGVSSLCAGGYGLRRATGLRRTGITAVGRIVRHDTRRDDDGAKYPHPVVTWTTPDGPLRRDELPPLRDPRLG